MSAVAQSVSISRPTLAVPTDPHRLSALALSGFLSLADFWRLTNSEAAALIGVSVSTLQRIRRGRRLPLRQDQLTRIAALIAIFKGLRGRFADEAADDWVIKPNADPLFGRADAGRGDDRRRHSADARRPPPHRRDARRVVNQRFPGKSLAGTACRDAPILRLNASASICAFIATVLSSRGSGHCASAPGEPSFATADLNAVSNRSRAPSAGNTSLIHTSLPLPDAATQKVQRCGAA